MLPSKKSGGREFSDVGRETIDLIKDEITNANPDAPTRAKRGYGVCVSEGLQSFKEERPQSIGPSDVLAIRGDGRGNFTMSLPQHRPNKRSGNIQTKTKMKP